MEKSTPDFGIDSRRVVEVDMLLSIAGFARVTSELEVSTFAVSVLGRFQIKNPTVEMIAAIAIRVMEVFIFYSASERPLSSETQ